MNEVSDVKRCSVCFLPTIFKAWKITLNKIFVLLALLLASQGSHAAFLTYDISSPDNLSNIAVGQTVHFDVFLPGIASQTWDDTAIFNAFATSSDDTLWGLPTNVIFNSELELSSLFFTSSSPGRVNWTYVDTPLTMLTDFVMSFDITAIAAGAGLFSANGADIFQASDQEDTFFTNSDSVDFNIVAEVPISNSLALIGVGLLCSVVSRRHLIT